MKLINSDKRPVLAGLAALVTVLLADQWSKDAILDLFEGAPYGAHIAVTRFFDLVLWWNKGVSFGMLHTGHDIMPYLLSGAAALICLPLAVWLCRTKNWPAGIALGMIMGGAIGNVIDRLQFGAVVDFLYFYYNEWYWPAFNIADSAICVGVALLLFGADKKPKAKAATAQETLADATNTPK